MCYDKYERRTIKMGAGVPTIPASTDHRNGDWIATDIYEGELYMDTNTGQTYTRVGSTIVTADNKKPYLIWKALITQSGTSAPTLTIVENTLGITAVPSYVGTGVFTVAGFAGNLTGDIEIHKNMVTVDYNYYFSLGILDVNTLYLETGNAGTPTNGLLTTGSSITVYVY